MKTIHDEIKEKCELAITYAEDGAFASAARVLQEAANIYRTRAQQIASEIGNNRRN